MTDADALEAELDSLFRLPPAEVVAARNSFAARWKKSGDKEGAARIAAVKRPTPAAWAINQVHFREPALLARASENAAKLRALHAVDGVEGRQLAAAVEAVRSATQAIVDAAVRFCEGARMTGGAPQERKIYTSVQSWLSGTADEEPGRMTHDVEASGFDAIGSVGLVLPPSAAGGAAAGGAQARGDATGGVAKATSNAAAARGGASDGGTAAGRAKSGAGSAKDASVAASNGSDPRALAFATEQLSKREREARAATERARERAAAQKEAERELERAKLQVKDAERALVHLRAAALDRATKVQQAEASTAEAEEDRIRAEEAVAHARTELANLRRA